MSGRLKQKNYKNMKLLDKLVARKLEFDKKYQNVNMLSLIRENCQNDEQIKLLVCGLEVLAKYCENILNPQHLRPQKWLAISLHNQIFMEKVYPIKGHREILNLIGYKKEEKGCLLFYGEVNVYIVAQIYLELKAIQSELRLWVEKRHPFPELFKGMLNSEPRPPAQQKMPVEPISLPVTNFQPEGDEDNVLNSISPNDTLTNENAMFLLKKQHRTSQQQQMPETNCAVQRRNETRSTKNSRIFKIYESDATRPATDPQVKRRPVYFKTVKSWGPESLKSRSEIWICDHCTAENHHSERACRTKSRLYGGDLKSFPEKMPHTCEICDKTTFVFCIEEAVVNMRKGIKSIMPGEDAKESSDLIGVGGNYGNNNSGDDESDGDIGNGGGGDDFSTRMKKILLRKEKSSKLLWSNRFQQFVKILHQQLGRVPEEEINYLFDQFKSILSDRAFQTIPLNINTVVMEIIKVWRVKVDDMLLMLKHEMVYRDRPWGEESKRLVKNCIISNSGNSELALKTFEEKWKFLLKLLKEECSIPELSERDYSDTLFKCGGMIEEAKVCLIKNRYLYSIWGQEGSHSEAAMDLYRDTRLLDPLINRAIKNKEIPCEKRVRILMCECDIGDSDLANQIIQLVDSSSNNKNLCVIDFLEALEGNNSPSEVQRQLMMVCHLCCENKPIRSFFKLPRCDCTSCKQCIKTHFEIRIRENPISSLVCPLCNEPKIKDDFDDFDYFPYLTKLLSNILEENVMNSLGEKLAKWHLKDEKVATCPWDCGEQFIIDSEIVDVKVIKCPNCLKFLCTDCQNRWIDKNHDCRTPRKEFEVVGVDLRSCPRCRQAYSLVKGGCLHMTCMTCNHQFCAECEESYENHPKMGFHCRHPRDCFFYLRDRNIKELLQLLDIYKIKVPDRPCLTNQATSLPVPAQSPTLEGSWILKRSESFCQSRVQKEDVGEEVICGEDLYNEELRLCCTHYTEYLYKMVRLHHVDPVHIMSEDDLKNLLKKHRVNFPCKSEIQGSYSNHLIKIIKDRIPLKRHSITSGPKSIYPIADYG